MKKFLFCIAAIAFLTFSCSDDDDGPDINAIQGNVLEAYATLVYANYEDAYNTAVELQTTINSFTANPSASGLIECKNKWLAAREPYGQTEAFRFYDGPIDGADGEPEGLINAWPLDESYIDYVESGTGGEILDNIIGNNTIALTMQSIMDLNGGDGTEAHEARVTTGFHAIEFLLWGQDLSDGPEAGQRAFTDFTIADNATRRIEYLKVVTDLLIENLGSVKDEWTPNQNNFRSTFVANTDGESIGHLFASIGKLSKGELAGERIQKGLTERDKEEEHSCFSDNTDRDIVTNALGIENVYYGRYTRINGTTIDGVGLDELVEAKEAILNNSIKDALVATKTAAAAIQQFDQEIRPDGDGNAGGDARVQAIVQTLGDQADLFVQAALLFGFTFDPADI